MKNISILTWLVLIQLLIAGVTSAYIISVNVESDRNNIKSEALTFAGHARQTAIAAEIFLRQITSEVQENPAVFDGFDKGFADKWALAAASIPQVRSVNLVNSQGVLVNDAVVRGTRVIDLSDREYFIRHSKGDRALIVTPPIFSRARNSWFFGMAIGVFAEDNRYLGSVVLGIEPRFFLNFFSSVGDAGLNVALLSQANVITAARFIDDIDPPIGEEMTGLPDTGRTEFSEIKFLGDGLASFIPVEGWPMRVVVHEPVDKILQRTMLPIVSFLLMLIVATAVVAYLINKLQRSEESLESEHQELLRLKEKLERQVSTDTLTGIRNRFGFFHDTQIEITRCARFKHPMTVMALDIDFFKSINDNYGHAIGDEALKSFADTCRNAIRDFDIIGRLGGEEFAIMLPETNIVDAERLADRIRIRVADTKVFIEKGRADIGFNYTVSIGVAAIKDDENIESALSRADDALYEAKEGGRNAVRVAA